MGSFKKARTGKTAGRSIGDRELRICQLDVETTIEHMEDTVRQYGADILAGGDPFYITISGFDDDPRELSEIPEAVEICERVINSGLFALVGDNAAIGAAKNEFVDAHICFQLAKGGLVKTASGWSRAFLTPAMAEEYVATMKTVNEKVDRLLSEPKPEAN